MSWEQKTLGEVAEIVSGSTPKSGVPRYWDGAVAWATPTDLSRLDGKYLDKTGRTITEAGLNECSARLLPPGSVLFSSRAPIGLVAINTKPMATNQGFKSFVPRPEVNADYLYWWLRANRRQLEDLGNGATFKEVSKAVVSRVQFPLPPLTEQRRIAAILDKADAIRRKREQTLALTDDFLKSAFLTMFGDPQDNPYGFLRERIGDRLSKTRPGTQSGPFGSALKKHEYTNFGIPVWGVENVHQNRFFGEARLFISAEKYEDLRRYSVVPGDILISRAGTVGRMCVAEPGYFHSIISTNLVRVSLDQSKLLPEYFVCLFTYFADRLGALKANNKDDAFTFLNPKTLREIKIPIPEIARQENFVRMARKLDGIMARAQDQRNGLSDLFSSLSQRAFRGEL